MLTSQSHKEFSDARQKAFIEEWLSFFTGRSKDLLSFEDVRRQLRLRDSSYKGLQEIELDKIVGSTGRYRDFTRTFLPKSDQSEDRWRRVDEVVHEQGLPPIEVYKVGDVYFVRDGNHRVSVARMHKAKTIEAYVIEYKTPVSLTKDDDLDDILLKAEQAKFFEETRLDRIRPEQNIVFTEPGRYRLVREHIAFHKYLKETECGCEIPYEEAVASWYDNVYLPVVKLIREQEVLKQFPNRTEADLYAWVLLHRAELEAELQSLGHIPNEEVLEDVTLEKSANPFVRLMGLFRRKLDLKTLPLKVERARFLEETQLDTLRPGHGIECSEPGCYQVLKEHIRVHKYLKETETSTEIPYKEAVESWYDNVYRPLLELIRERQVLEFFPEQTETDLYLCLVARRAELEEDPQAVNQALNEKVIDDLARECRSSAMTRLAQSFWH